MQKKTIFIFCTRLFDYRYLKSTNIIDYLSKNLNIIFFVDNRHKKLIEKSLNYKYIVKPILHEEEEYEKNNKNLSYAICKIIQLIFSFTYANLKIKQNRTRQLHVKSFLLKRKNSSFFRLVFTYLIIILAKLSGEFSIFRRLLQYIFNTFVPRNKHQKDFKEFKPISSLFCSFGFGIDTLLMQECKEIKLRSSQQFRVGIKPHLKDSLSSSRFCNCLE